MDVIPAVIDHRRGNGGENRSPDYGTSAQTIHKQRQQENDSDTEDDRDYSKGGVGELAAVGCSCHPRLRQAGVIERRSMVFVSVILISAAVDEFGEFDPIDGLVVVQRARSEGWEAERQG